MADSETSESLPAKAWDGRDAFVEHLRIVERHNWEDKIFYKPDDVKSWMKAQMIGKTYPNVVDLVDAVYATDSFEKVRDLQSSNYLLVFAALVHPDVNCGHLIHIFKQCDLSDYYLELADPSNFYKSIIKEMDMERPLLPSNYAQYNYAAVIEAFDKVRWAFCPVTLSLFMDRSFTFGSSILPFVYAEVVNQKGGTANVHHYKIQEDLVELENLRTVLEPTRHKVAGKGDCYDIAVKSYFAGWEDAYRSESEAFKGLRDHKGVVAYLGEYHFREGGNIAPKHNIVLEYGQQDLDEYLAETYPPVSNTEIIQFWGDLFEVADTLRRMHQFKHEGENGKVRPFKGWHGDIKPDNILRVRGRFKLADFGFTKFEKDVIGKMSTFMAGGTQAYGAPECDHRRLGTNTPHLQTIDTWSFGCVLSAVATWVILGSQAHDNYRQVRMMEIAELRARKGADAPSGDDAFHDGTKVLPCVINWHNYLRNSARRADTISYRVLDLVQKEMLLPDPGLRLTLAQLCKQLREILVLAREEYAESIDKGDLKKIDPGTLKALLKLDRSAPETAAPARSQNVTAVSLEDEGSSTLSVNAQVLPHLRPTSERVRKSERLEKVVIGKTANRERAIESDLKFDTNFQTENTICESPKQDPVDAEYDTTRPFQPIRKRAQKSKTLEKGKGSDIPGIYLTTNDSPSSTHPRQSSGFSQYDRAHVQSANSSSSGISQLVLNDAAGTANISPRVEPHVRSYFQGTPTREKGTESFGTSDRSGVDEDGPVSAYENRIPMTPPSAGTGSVRQGSQGQRDFWNGTQQKNHFSASGTALPPSPQMSPKVPYEPYGSRVSEVSVPRSAKSPAGSHRASQIPAIYKEQELLKAIWEDKKGPFSTLLGRIPEDKRLKKFISDRDIVFVADNASSMKQYWQTVTEVLVTLAMKIGPLDKDGLDLIYTIGSEHQAREVKGWEIPTRFRHSMEHAGRDIVDRDITNMKATLQRIFDDYWKNTSKRMTLIILTDGLWEGCAHENDVKEQIINFITMLSDKRKRFESRWFSIQFISFGNNTKALERLQDLDDNMPKTIEDVIDTKPWYHSEVEELILGSMTDEFDKAPALAPSESFQSLQLPESTRSRSSSRRSRVLKMFQGN